jgi:hypothetical protein
MREGVLTTTNSWNTIMRIFKSLSLILFLLFFFGGATMAQQNPVTDIKPSVYNVKRLKKPMKIDANWNKPQWKKIKPVEVENYLGATPKFRPEVEAKMMYDDENVYVIFHVKDRYVKVVTKDIGGKVWTDSACEFFFSPDESLPLSYFNLEMNGGGTPLLGHREKKPVVEDIKKIEIAHSLPQIVDPEITEPVTWTLEYRIPLAMIGNYANVTRPKKGVTWRGNFYKIAEITSNPHYITWSRLPDNKPNFHQPPYFGILKFQ